MPVSKKPASKPVSKKVSKPAAKPAENSAIEFLSNVLTSTEDRFLKLLDQVITNQELGKKKAKEFTKKVTKFRDENVKKVTNLVNDSVKKALKTIDVARGSEVKELKEKIKTLEKKIGSRRK